MTMRATWTLTLLGLLLLASGVSRAESFQDDSGTSSRPTLMLRIKALQDLISDLRYLVKEIGREQEAKQVEALLKARTGPNGLEGVEVKKPIGLYALVQPSLNQSEIVLLLPIADEKTFLEFLDTLNFKPEKDKQGLYTLQVETIPVPLLFRFAHGYLYGTAKLNEQMTLPPADKLPSPEKILGKDDGLMSLTLQVEQIPAQVRKLAISASSLMLGELKDRDLPAATDKQKAVWTTALDEGAKLVKSLLQEATTAQVKLDLDRKSKDLSLAFRLQAKPGSPLAKNLASLNPSQSISAGLSRKDSVLAGFGYLELPSSIHKVFAPAIEEAIDKAVQDLDSDKKDLLNPFIASLKPTAKSGRLDLGLSLLGPGKKGKYTLVLASRLEKGIAVEKAFKDLLQKLPAEAKEPLRIDMAKQGEIAIHSIQQKEVDDRARELFGTGPLYFALRDDALIVTLGEEALTQIKQATQTKATAGQPLQLVLSAARLAPLMAREQKAAPDAARKAFTEKGDDQMRLTISAGDQLEVKLSIQTAILKFASLINQAQNEG